MGMLFGVPLCYVLFQAMRCRSAGFPIQTTDEMILKEIDHDTHQKDISRNSS
jgi:hypothetical protein